MVREKTKADNGVGSCKMLGGLTMLSGVTTIALIKEGIKVVRMVVM